VAESPKQWEFTGDSRCCGHLPFKCMQLSGASLMDSSSRVKSDRNKRDLFDLVSPYHYLVAKEVSEQSHSYAAEESVKSKCSGFPNVAQPLGCELTAHALLTLELPLSC
jgi:hypothetical protein